MAIPFLIIGLFDILVAIPHVGGFPRYLDFIMGGLGVFLVVFSLREIMS